MHLPVVGEVWTKYQVAQLSRVLGTLLVGGIPLVQALETTGRSLGTKLLKQALDKTSVQVREGQYALVIARFHRHHPRFGHRHDGSGRIHRRAAPDAL